MFGIGRSRAFGRRLDAFAFAFAFACTLCLPLGAAVGLVEGIAVARGTGARAGTSGAGGLGERVWWAERMVPRHSRVQEIELCTSMEEQVNIILGDLLL